MGCATSGAHPDRETFYGNVAIVAGPAMGGSGQLMMVIEEWTPASVRQEFGRALANAGQDALYQAARKHDQGYMKFPSLLGWRLIFAHKWQTPDGKTKIRLATDRPILFREAAFNTRSMDYPFGIVEFTLDEEGKGEGFFIEAAKLSFDQYGNIVFETFFTEPQKLVNVTMKQK